MNWRNSLLRFSFLIPQGKKSRIHQFPKSSRKSETQMRNSFSPIAPPQGSPRNKKSYFLLFLLGQFVFAQVILFEIDCVIFYINLHELFCQFISWTNWVNSGKFMDNFRISCQVMADMEKFYDDLIIINLYQLPTRKQ